MSLISELEQLKELPPPPMPALWPQTWGWGLVLALALFITTAVLIRWRQKWKANAYRRVAMAELAALEALWRKHPEDTALLREVPELLKRAVLSRPGQTSKELPSMGGRDWQNQLERMSDMLLSKDFSARLADLAYASDMTLEHLDLEALINECRQWLETHHDPV